MNRNFYIFGDISKNSRKGPAKPPDAAFSLDGDDRKDDIVRADEGEEKNVPADEGIKYRVGQLR